MRSEHIDEIATRESVDAPSIGEERCGQHRGIIHFRINPNVPGLARASFSTTILRSS